MKRFFVSVLIVVALVAAGAGIVVSVWAVKLATPEERIEAPEALPNVRVRVLEGRTVEDFLYLTGLVEPWESVTLSSEVMGKIEWQGVDDGVTVEKGEDIIRINQTSIHARLDQAQAQYDLAVQDFDRVNELRQRGISSPQERDRAVSNRDAAKAALRLAQIDLDHSAVKAEIGGIVDHLYSETGEFVAIGTHLIRLVQVDRLKVLVGLPERDVVHFKVGDRAALQFDALPERTFTGIVHQISTTAEPSTRTFITEIEVGNEDGTLRPGMIARVRLVRSTYPDAITVPMFSLLSRPEGRYVFLEEDAHARMRPVTVGFLEAGQALITQGLAPGDRLIVTGQRMLQDGDSLRVGEVVSGS